MFNKTKKHSPLKDPLLHYPGQSISKKINTLINDDGASYIVIILTSLLMIFDEWYRWYFKVPQNPSLVTLLYLGFCLFALVKIRRIKKSVDNYDLGRQGELTVGLDLELLFLPKKIILHDIPFFEGNIDHVLITSSGVFSIETKTWRKVGGKDSTIKFEGGNYLKDDEKFGYHPSFLQQPVNEAHFIEDLLQDRLGKFIKVQPVLLCPNWYIEPSAMNEAKKSGVWFENLKYFELRMKDEPSTLTDKEISDIVRAIADYVRDKDEVETKK